MLGLLASAIIGSMPEMLPAWREVPQWSWTWFRDSAKTFLNFRKMMDRQPVVAIAKVVPPPTPKEEEITGPQQLNG